MRVVIKVPDGQGVHGGCFTRCDDWIGACSCKKRQGPGVSQASFLDAFRGQVS